METLELVPFYCGPTSNLLDRLTRVLETTFRVHVHRRPPAFDPEVAFDPARGQYDSRLLLGQLLRHHPESFRVLGVTDVDLFMPVLTFVFGEAQLHGRVAVVSTHRLVPERYGLPPDPALLEDRLTKEAVHELGHTFDLIHCVDGRCVMASSPGVEGIDIKSSRFCRTCRSRLRVRG